jgi:hypothetical protein
MAKRNVSDAKKKMVAGRQNFKCANNPAVNITGLDDYKCPLWQIVGEKQGLFDEAGYDIDHIREHSISHDDKINNLQALCKMCHPVKTKRFLINNKPQSLPTIEKYSEIITFILYVNEFTALQLKQLCQIMGIDYHIDKKLTIEQIISKTTLSAVQEIIDTNKNKKYFIKYFHDFVPDHMQYGDTFDSVCNECDICNESAHPKIFENAFYDKHINKIHFICDICENNFYDICGDHIDVFNSNLENEIYTSNSNSNSNSNLESNSNSKNETDDSDSNSNSKSKSNLENEIDKYEYLGKIFSCKYIMFNNIAKHCKIAAQKEAKFNMGELKLLEIQNKQLIEKIKYLDEKNRQFGEKIINLEEENKSLCKDIKSQRDKINKLISL